MIRSNAAHRVPILLATLGGSALLVLSALSSSGARTPVIGTPSPPAVEPRRAELVSASTVRVAQAGSLAPEESVSLESIRLRPAATVPRSPTRERELRALFSAEGRTDPGSLERRARAVLEGGGPRCEKVALLLALEDCGSPETAAWLEFAVRSLPDDSDPHAVSLPSFALERLASSAARDGAARRALTHVAFDRTAARADLRRRAAAHLAAVAAGDELGALRWELAHEPDELLVAGVLSVLDGRAGEPGVRALLASHGRHDRIHSVE